MLKKIENYLAIGGIFLVGAKPLFGMIVLSQISIILLFLIQLLKRLLLSKFRISIFFIEVILFITFSTFFLNYLYVDFSIFKMFFGIIIYYFAYYWHFKERKYDLKTIVRLYIKSCVVASLIAFIQEIGFLLRINFLYDFSSYLFGVHNITSSGIFLRVYSLFIEPGHFGNFLTPAIYLGVQSFLNNKNAIKMIKKKETVLIVLAFFLTFSVVAYFNLLLIILFLLIKSKIKIWKKVLVILCVTLIVITTYFSVSNVNQKINSLSKGLKNEKFLTSSSGLSAFAFIGNIKVTIVSLKNNPLFGTGLNTHRFSYKKYIGLYYTDLFSEINSDGTVSLYIRILSEFGILGFMLFILSLIKFKMNKRSKILMAENYLLNEMGFISVIGIAIRNGHYLNPIIIFSFLIMQITWQMQKKGIKNEKYINNNNMVSE